MPSPTCVPGAKFQKRVCDETTTSVMLFIVETLLYLTTTLTRTATLIVVLAIRRSWLGSAADLFLPRDQDLLASITNPCCLVDLEKLWKEIRRQTIRGAFAADEAAAVLAVVRPGFCSQGGLTVHAP